MCFRDHDKVVPAVGLVKKIDFFIGDIPFDLKITHLPEGFIAENRQQAGLKSELALLKRSARDLRIHFDPEMPSGKLLEDLWTKHQDHPSSSAKNLIAELLEQRQHLVKTCGREPSNLIRWLYENQGLLQIVWKLFGFF